MNSRNLLSLSVVLSLGGLLLVSAVVQAGATPRKMSGTWLALVEVTLAPGQTEILPELGTFGDEGAVVMSTGFPPLTLPFDQGAFTAVVNLGQGNWVFRGGQFHGTQLRFVADDAGMPRGFTKLVSEWRLVDRNTAAGTYRAEILQPDGQPYTIGGLPAVFVGDFEMLRIPIETLP